MSLKHDIVEMASFYEHSLLKGNKTMFHLEAFIAKFMLLYSKFMEESLNGIFQLKYCIYYVCLTILIVETAIYNIFHNLIKVYKLCII